MTVRNLPTSTPDLADVWLAQVGGEDVAYFMENEYDPDLPYGPMMDMLP